MILGVLRICKFPRFIVEVLIKGALPYENLYVSHPSFIHFSQADMILVFFSTLNMLKKALKKSVCVLSYFLETITVKPV